MNPVHMLRPALICMSAACGAENPSPESATIAESESVELTEPATGAATPASEATVAREVPSAEQAPSAAPPDAAWAELLTQFQTDAGFRYASLAADESARARLAEYVDAIGRANVEGASSTERLAFFLNAYNAITINAVVARWPIDSVMNVPGFFDEIEHQVAGSAMTLNHLENQVIRGEEFGEARIHFAVNCASASCPPLRGTPFRADTLEEGLEEQTQLFVRATTTVDGRSATVSKLFEWFAADFESPGVKEFIALRLNDEDASTLREDRTRLRFSEYDWAINAVE